MTRDQRTARVTLKRQRGSRRALAGGLVLLAFATGCEGLMDVKLPGQLLEEDLNDPRLAVTLARSVESDFECAFTTYVLATGLWTRDFIYAGNTRSQHQTSVRNTAVETFADASCESINPPSIWLPLNVVRVQGEGAVQRIESFQSDAVQNRDLLLAKSHAYTGYAYTLLGEAMCELAFDGGPMVTREEAWRKGEEKFTKALEHANLVTTGATAAEARSIRNMALVGRARARLNLGNRAGVVADANQVDANFVRNVTTSAADARRYNRVFTFNNESRLMAVHSSYHNLTVGGVKDPRINLFHHGFGTGFDGKADMWFQMKYPSRSAAMPFSSWREAQLMIAEVEGGQVAVAAINRLRTTHNLPQFASADAAEISAQVREERRRELWLQGTRLGDMLRLDLPFPTGVDHRGEPYGNLTCYPLSDQEKISNPNL